MDIQTLLDGVVIPIDKPRGWTSFQAVGKVRAAIRSTYGIKKFKIGHAGTLDPLATGLLLICVGKATKRIDELQQGIKVYSGTMVLGATTPCYDLERAIDHYYPYEHITAESIESVLPQFIGDISQVPPVFSAVKIDGQRAYKYAREADGDAPEPVAKRVHVDQFVITAFRPSTVPPSITQNQETQQPLVNHHLYNNPQGTVPPHLPQADFIITCGKGTYIRSLARDMGIALGSGAFLASLRRERIGNYTLDNAISIDGTLPNSLCDFFSE